MLYAGAGDTGLVLGMEIEQSFQSLLYILKWEIKNIFPFPFFYQDKRYTGCITKLKKKLVMVYDLNVFLDLA